MLTRETDATLYVYIYPMHHFPYSHTPCLDNLARTLEGGLFFFDHVPFSTALTTSSVANSWKQLELKRHSVFRKNASAETQPREKARLVQFTVRKATRQATRQHMARKAFTERWEDTSKSVQGQTHGRIKSGYKACKICCGHFFLLFFCSINTLPDRSHTGGYLKKSSDSSLETRLSCTQCTHAAIPFPSLAIVKTVPRPAPLEKRQETHRKRSSLERNAHYVL